MSEFTAPNVFLRRYVPNDHECVFTAIGYLCEGVQASHAVAARLRKVIGSPTLEI